MYLYVRNLEHVCLSDVNLVGGKNASLGEMISALHAEGIQVPGGFVITADAYSLLLDAGVREELSVLLSNVNANDVKQLRAVGKRARKLIRQAGIPAEVCFEVARAYQDLERKFGKQLPVVVRSSATAEDLPDASFAGQQESFVNVVGELDLLDACLECFASLFTDRAISYRIDKGYDHMDVRLSIGVQQMVRSDLASAGVIFTLDPESGHRNVVLVTAAYGLGENVVAGRVDPDEILIFKQSLDKAPKPIVRRKVGAKQQKAVLSNHGSQRTRNVPVLPHDAVRLSLSDEDALKLARWAVQIENHYSTVYGKPTPMDIEWAKDGLTGELYIVQARPETIHAQTAKSHIDFYDVDVETKPLLTGRAIGEKVGAGVANVIHSPHEIDRFRPGQVLVADMTDPDWEPIMKNAAAIITNRGGRTCHAAIISRELGVPCLVGAGNATELLKDVGEVTVVCSQGSTGSVFRGRIPFEKRSIILEDLPETKTKLMINVGNPESALKTSMLPCSGVGLAREEFIIAREVQIHPMALAHPERVADEKVRAQIERITQGFDDPAEYFVCKLAEGIGTIAAAFFPRPVVVRLSDFKTNEYSSLIGGEFFEPKEENPMIGFRGACRYYDDRYRDGFALECRAILKVINEMGMSNLKLLVPFCRTAGEGRLVIAELKRNGIDRHQLGLEVLVMCELPANVFAIEDFAEVFDGFSIGSNDLTQLVLGVDRDSQILAPLFDERDLAVKNAIAIAVHFAKTVGKKIGICGQAPSDYPDVVRFLIEQGIDSISLNEDAFLKTLLIVSEIESAVANAKQQSQLVGR